jgi:hypothetical protein
MMSLVGRLMCIVALGSASVAGCVDQRAQAPPTVELSLEDGEPVVPPTIPMARAKLATHQEYDRLEKDLLVRMTPEDLVPIYRELARDADPASSKEDVLLLQRLALLHLRSQTGNLRLQDAFSVADRLRQAVPDDPDTLYLLANITQLLVGRHPDGTYRVESRRRDVAERLVQSWRSLLERDADYRGPHGDDAARIRKDLETLEVALKAKPAEAPISAPSPTATDEDPATREVQRLLGAFSTGTDVQRASLCRDWDLEREGKLPAGEAARWADLHCGFALKAPDRSLDALSALVTAGAYVDPCRWLGKIEGGSAATRSALSAATTPAGFGPCSPGR